jgi:signal transduction histidine kinase
MTEAAPAVRARPSRWEALGQLWHRHRERVDDVVLVLFVAGGAVAIVLLHLSDGLTAGTWWRVALTLAVAVGLWWRRRRPLLLAVAACAAVALGASELALQATLLTLAVRRRDRVLGVVAAAAALAYVVTPAPQTAQTDPIATTISALVSAVFFVGLPVAVGAYVGARRDLVRTLLERAERAETAQLLRAEQARLSERTRIAQEMHDVLAHRISLVALHAGGLEVNPAVGAPQVERSAALIRTTARQALEDLRGVLGVLRADTSADGTDLLPQPTLADVDRLIGASAEAGVAVRLVDELPAGSAPPPLLGRTAYRVVQEGLTNVHKHAPGATAGVRLAGAPGAVLEVEVRNARPVSGQAAPLVPGSGLGLVGLRERVELAGGSLEAGPQAGGGFAVRARLPWPAGSEAPA